MATKYRAMVRIPRTKTTLEHEVRMDSPSSIGGGYGGFKHFYFYPDPWGNDPN